MNIRPGIAWSVGAAGPVLTALASDEPQMWMDLAACTAVDPEIFHPQVGESNRPAKAICAGCFVRADCLAYALELGDVSGIWGGLSDFERRSIRKPRVHVPVPVKVTAKRCPSCETTKHVDEFFRHRGRHDGLDGNCKDCRSGSRKARAAA